MKDYHINIFYSDEDGGYIADIPDLKICSGFGATPEEALREVEQAKAAWLDAARAKASRFPSRSIDPSFIKQLERQIWRVAIAARSFRSPASRAVRPARRRWPDGGVRLWRAFPGQGRRPIAARPAAACEAAAAWLRGAAWQAQPGRRCPRACGGQHFIKRDAKAVDITAWTGRES